MRSVLHSALLTLSFALTVQACAAPVTGPLNGQIRDWPAGKTGEVRLTLRAGPRAAATDAVLATAPVDAGGKFSLTLPDAAALERLLPPGADTWSFQLPCNNADGVCPVALNLGSAARLAFFDLQAYADEERLNTVKFANSVLVNFRDGQVRNRLVYSSAPVKITGEAITVTNGSAQLKWDTALAAGWNWMSEKTGPKDAATGLWSVSITDSALPTDAWYYLTSGGGSVGMALVGGTQASTMIHRLKPGGAAEKAGLQVGDLILEVDGVPVKDVAPSAVAGMTAGEPGMEVVFKVLRGEETLVIRVVRDFVEVK